jgi:hypothetical protein
MNVESLTPPASFEKGHQLVYEMRRMVPLSYHPLSVNVKVSVAHMNHCFLFLSFSFATNTSLSEYARWCFEQGWIVPQVTHKGSYGKITDYPKREEEDWSDSDYLPIASWSTFTKVWKKDFPHLKVRPACEDTCGECFIYRNRFKYADRIRRQQEVAERQSMNLLPDSSSSSSSSSSEDDSLDDDLSNFVAEYPEEALMFQANEHCVQAQAQRELANERIQTAKATKNLPWNERW